MNGLVKLPPPTVNLVVYNTCTRMAAPGTKIPPSWPHVMDTWIVYDMPMNMGAHGIKHVLLPDT